MWWRRSWFSLNDTIGSRERKGALSYATQLLTTNQPIRAPVSGKGTIGIHGQDRAKGALSYATQFLSTS